MTVQSGIQWLMAQLRRTPAKRRREIRRRRNSFGRGTGVETLEVRELLSATSDQAFSLLHQRVAENQQAFFVYKDGGDPLNHGEPVPFDDTPLDNQLRLTVNSFGIVESESSLVISSDPTRLDRTRGTVLHLTFPALSTGQFAGVAFTGTQNVPTSIDVRNATQLVFDARTTNPAGQRVNIDIGGNQVERTIAAGTAFQTISIPLSSLSGAGVNIAGLQKLFAIGVNDLLAPSGTQITLDNIRFESTPSRQSTELSLPLGTATFGVVPEGAEAIENQPAPNYPIDQVLKNVATVYESSMVVQALLQRGTAADDTAARQTLNAFAYAMGHDDPSHNGIPVASDGSRALHDAYTAGDIAKGPGSTGNGGIRFGGFSVGAEFQKYYLVLDGANGGNLSFAIMAFLEGYRHLGDQAYLDRARELGRWIIQTLKDSSSLTNGFGGFYFGYEQGGAPTVPGTTTLLPRVLTRSKSIENNADIFAAMWQLSVIDRAAGRQVDADMWLENANHAGDFVMRLFDRVQGRFYAGTVPVGTPASAGVDPTGEAKTTEVINRFDFLDAQSFIVLAMAGAARYRNQINWRLPVDYMLAKFKQTATANGRTFQGFSITRQPTPFQSRGPSATGISWEFTGQAVAAMRFVDSLCGESRYASAIATYNAEIRSAQLNAPYKDGLGLVAATVDGQNESSPTPPRLQGLTSPFQIFPERVGLAATTWAIIADLGRNPFVPRLADLTILGPCGLTRVHRPTITWVSAPNAASYEVVIEKLSPTLSTVVRQTVTTPAFTPTSDLPIGAYRVSVRSMTVSGQKSAWSASQPFQIAVPVTLRPIAGNVTTQRPTLEWDALPGAARYDLWLNQVSTGQSQFIRRTDLTTTSFSPTIDLAIGAYRFWVRGIDATGFTSSWSRQADFNVNLVPILTAPVTSGQSSQPNFTWNAVPSAVRYELVVRSLTTGRTVLEQRDVGTNSFRPATNLPSGNYRWWVRAIGSGTFTGGWSNSADFSVQ